jgi:Kef-type K+ transport system membrane component KefB
MTFFRLCAFCYSIRKTYTSHEYSKGGEGLDILLKIGIALVIGIIGGKLAKLVKLPSVSGYLVAGLFVGPSIFGDGALFSSGELSSLSFISELALAFIAFSIGSEFVLSDMKKYGKKVFIITIAEVLGAVILVFSLMFFVFQKDFAFSMVIASMSAATAPAATLMVMRQYRAYGPMTKTLLSVVALDDVVGIIVFGVSLSLAKMYVSGEAISITSIIIGPLKEILGSIVLGFILGLILTIVAKKQKEHDRDDLQVISIIAILLGVGIANWLGLSPLLTNIAIGMTLVNLMKKSVKVFDSVNSFVAPFYVLFFTFAGASLDLQVLLSVGILGVAYIFARGFGKYIGALIGGKLSKADRATNYFLGLGLLPQGGISIGLSVIVASQLPQYAVFINTIIMFSVLVYETTGPIFSKLSISLAGEINGLDKVDETYQKDAELALSTN